MIKKILIILFFSLNSNAALEVTIAQGKVEPTPIAITQIFGADSDTARSETHLDKLFQIILLILDFFIL